MKELRKYQTKIVAQNIRFYRDRAGLSQAELAFKSDISSVAMFESEKRYPEPDSLAKIAGVLDVTVSDLTRDRAQEAIKAEKSDLREKIKQQLDSRSPAEKSMADFVYEIIEENRNLRAELEALKNHPILDAYEKAEPAARSMVLEILKPGTPVDLEELEEFLSSQNNHTLSETKK